jgi:hypothetical protein
MCVLHLHENKKEYSLFQATCPINKTRYSIMAGGASESGDTSRRAVVAKVEKESESERESERGRGKADWAQVGEK